MAAAYRRLGMDGPASFELFVRHLPEPRNFLVAAGLEPVLDHLEQLRFEPDELDYLRTLGLFDEDFVASLGRAAVHRRRVGRARGRGRVRRGAHPAGDGAAARGPDRRDLPADHHRLRDHDRLQGGAHRHRLRARPHLRRLLGPPRPRPGRRGRGGAGRLHRRGGGDVERRGGPAVRACRSAAPWPTPTCCRSRTSTTPSPSYARTFPDRTVLLIDTYDTEEGARIAAAGGRRAAGRGHHHRRRAPRLGRPRAP